MLLRRATRTIAVAALACLLSACWFSERPLIADRDAAVVPFTGAFVGDGEEGEDLVVSAGGDGYYDLANGNESRIPARFSDLGGGWYLMQGMAGGDKPDAQPIYLYQPVKYSGGDLYFHSPDCEDITGKFKGLKRESGMDSSKGQETCNFSRFDGLKAAAQQWIASFEAGRVTSNPQIFREFSTGR